MPMYCQAEPPPVHGAALLNCRESSSPRIILLQQSPGHLEDLGADKGRDPTFTRLKREARVPELSHQYREQPELPRVEVPMTLQARPGGFVV